MTSVHIFCVSPCSAEAPAALRDKSCLSLLPYYFKLPDDMAGAVRQPAVVQAIRETGKLQCDPAFAPGLHTQVTIKHLLTFHIYDC